MFKFLGKFRYSGIEHLPQELFIEGFAVNMKFIENKTNKITAGHVFYLL